VHLKILKILIAILLTVIVLLYDEYKALGSFYFYTLTLWGAFDIIKKKKIELIHVWNAAFGFIILSEVFSDKFTVSQLSLTALQLLIIANNIVYIGYISFKKIAITSLGKTTHTVKYKTKKITSYIIIILVFFFFFFKINSVLSSMEGGRAGQSDEGSFIFGSILNALGFILPALTAYYFIIIKKKTILKAFLIASPIFIIQFLIGTRFPLLFSVLGFVIVTYSKFPSKKFNFKSSFLIVFSLLVLIFGSEAMKSFRTFGFESNKKNNVFQVDYDGDTNIPASILSLGSPEGVIDMTTLLFDYFEHHDHMYGKSTGFILYFWVPRVIWPDKPTMLGNWLIREYRSGFGSGHSSSFGFTGELFSDFRYFSLIFIFFIGRLLAKANAFKDRAFNSNSYQLIIGAMLFPYVFFFVRSPITATINFLAILFFYFLFKRLFVSK
jgi:oligosaccharide repeat unit polymerase